MARLLRKLSLADLQHAFGIGKKRANAGVNTGSKPEYWYYYGMFGDVHAIRKGSFEEKCMKAIDIGNVRRRPVRCRVGRSGDEDFFVLEQPIGTDYGIWIDGELPGEIADGRNHFIRLVRKPRKILPILSKTVFIDKMGKFFLSFRTSLLERTVPAAMANLICIATCSKSGCGRGKGI